MTASIKRRDAMESTFEGPVLLYIHPLLNFTENLLVKGIFLVFLIKEIFIWSLWLIGKPQPERQSVRKPDSCNSVISSAISPSLPCLSLVGMCNWEWVWNSCWGSCHCRGWTRQRSLAHLQCSYTRDVLWAGLGGSQEGEEGQEWTWGMEQVLFLKAQ